MLHYCHKDTVLGQVKVKKVKKAVVIEKDAEYTVQFKFRKR
jgi:hypothetical protein